jgi:putative tryptophan/tyrosine transport system substrate-binding protein
MAHRQAFFPASRREFITLLGGAVASPLAARAQQGNSMRRIGVLIGWDENDPLAKAGLARFTQGLQELGWTDGRNLRMDIRWAAGDVSRMQAYAKELVGMQPDVILANTTPVTAALQRETQTIPIVFAAVADPVGEGFVASLPRPGGNITGFSTQEDAMAGKWLELLTQIAPGVKRVAIMFNPDTAPGGGSYFPPLLEAAARSFKVEPITAPVHSDAEIETVIASAGREPRGGLVVTPDAFVGSHRAPIISLAARHKVPAVYHESIWAREGGLLSYGVDRVDIFRRSASYVDRVLRGAKPADLPVQRPTNFELAVNLKTAKALGLTVTPSILVRADEVIE